MGIFLTVQVEQTITGNLAVIISAISALIAALSTVAAFMSNHQNKKQYLESIQPQLSMSLVEFNSWLYLRIKNTGKSAAKNISLSIKTIKNNGYADKLDLDLLFSSSFELYPEETVQGTVALYGRDISHTSFPSVEIDVSYDSDVDKRKCQYTRIVTFLSAYNEKISADVSFDKSGLEAALDSISRASVRIANYLDGRQAAPFDQLNTTSQKSLRDDLLDVHRKSAARTHERQSLVRSITEDDPDAHT